MAFIVDENGTIKLYQGDSGDLVVNGIPTDQNYKVYLAIQDAKRNPVVNEIMVNSLLKSSVSMYLDSSVTDLLQVPTNKKYETYYYGIKLCTPGTLEEDTLFIENSDFGVQNKIIVYPKIVEGTK